MAKTEEGGAFPNRVKEFGLNQTATDRLLSHRRVGACARGKMPKNCTLAARRDGDADLKVRNVRALGVCAAST